MTTRQVLETLCSNDDVEVLDATEAAACEYGYRYGAELICLRPEHIRALRDGKMLAWNDDEYFTFVVLSAPDEGYSE